MSALANRQSRLITCDVEGSETRRGVVDAVLRDGDLAPHGGGHGIPSTAAPRRDASQGVPQSVGLGGGQGRDDRVAAVVETSQVEVGFTETERSELVCLAFAVALAQLAALTVEDLAGESMAGFDAVELGEDAPPVGLVVEVGKQVEGFRDPAEFGDSAPGGGGPAAALQDAEDFAGADGAGGQAAGERGAGRPRSWR